MIRLEKGKGHRKLFSHAQSEASTSKVPAKCSVHSYRA